MRARAANRRRNRVFEIAIVLSILIHFVIGPLFSRHGLSVLSQNVPPDMVVMSSAIRIERRPVPKPQPRVLKVVQPHPRPQPRPEKRVVEKPQPPRTKHEQIQTPHLESRIAQTQASPVPERQPQKSAFEKQEQQFAKTIAQAQAQQNPLNVPSSAPAAPKRYTLQFEGKDAQLNRGEGILTPIKSWSEGGYNYYYVDYQVVFANGTRDQGRVPWPIRYRPNVDPFALNERGPFPLPAPLPGYVLPQGLPLGPVLRPYFPQIYPNG